MGSKYRTYEIKVSPKLISKLFDFVKANANQDHQYIIDALCDLSYCDDKLTLDEYEMIVTKPVV